MCPNCTLTTYSTSFINIYYIDSCESTSARWSRSRYFTTMAKSRRCILPRLCQRRDSTAPLTMAFTHHSMQTAQRVSLILHMWLQIIELHHVTWFRVIGDLSAWSILCHLISVFCWQRNRRSHTVWALISLRRTNVWNINRTLWCDCKWFLTPPV